MSRTLVIPLVTNKLFLGLFGALLGASPGFSQEVSLDRLPLKMQQPVPDRVMYHLFLRHVAGMERLAQEAQASGKDPGPWRRHALRKFSLTEEERQKLLPIANQYEAQVRKQQEQSHSITSDFKARYFPAGK